MAFAEKADKLFDMKDSLNILEMHERHDSYAILRDRIVSLAPSRALCGDNFDGCAHYTVTDDAHHCCATLKFLRLSAPPLQEDEFDRLLEYWGIAEKSMGVYYTYLCSVFLKVIEPQYEEISERFIALQDEMSDMCIAGEKTESNEKYAQLSIESDEAFDCLNQIRHWAFAQTERYMA